MIESSKILFFGTGQITNKLISKLISAGKQVICVSDNEYGQIDNLSHVNIEFLSYKEILSTDIHVSTAIFSWKDSSKLDYNNHALSRWLGSNEFNATKSFFLSSASVYKDSKNPQDELSATIIDNEKIKLENTIKNITLKKNIKNINLRISNIYGIDINYGFIGSLFRSIKEVSEVRLLKNLDITRDYIHVDDVLYAIEMLLEIDTNKDCINISTGVGTSISQVLEIFSNRGYVFENRFMLQHDFNIKKVSILDCTLLSQLINWKPSNLSQSLNIILPLDLSPHF
jgi:nucleoside-diphosphate-sugar epimerase